MSQEPSIKIYMQQQENNALHHSNVFVLRDFLSDEIMQKWQEMENELSFQAQTNSDKYLRVASRVFDPPPLVIFGNEQNNLRLYEATQTKGIEEIILDMAKYTFDLMDEVINEVLDEIVTLLQQHQVTALSVSNSKCIRFRTKLDTPDSVVTLVSKGNKTYGHHTDTRPCKYDNHDNDDEENPQRHEMFMVSLSRLLYLILSLQDIS